ncbi:hypothetical protein [Allopontixanthobacter sp.]|uniref:hypothetical protein n=1 Tax=Allopontixanthobacter sp. TaxID=2906452 RepID=UPI002ABA0A35|nr:hypothetical protein [Allopontixanthobacter sp.]MDZ4308530.1 hypothetical protein [Allopontixanthobacter sp.]
MKILASVAIAASLALPLSAIQAQKADIVVSSNRSIERFAEDISRDLDRHLQSPTPLRSQVQESGVAQVLFQCGPDGKPANITMYRGASSLAVNRLAKRAVSKIKVLHPLPSGLSEDQLYLANIIIANSPVQHAQLSRQLQKREAQRLASGKDLRKIFAFNVRNTPST